MKTWKQFLTEKDDRLDRHTRQGKFPMEEPGMTMKTWKQFLTEKDDRLDRHTRQGKFPMEEPAPETERELVEDPHTSPIWYNIHTTQKTGIFYVQRGKPFMDACEWHIKTIPVRAYNNATAVELKAEELGNGWMMHYTQSLEELSVFNHCNQYKISRYI